MGEGDKMVRVDRLAPVSPSRYHLRMRTGSNLVCLLLTFLVFACGGSTEGGSTGDHSGAGSTGNSAGAGGESASSATGSGGGAPDGGEIDVQCTGATPKFPIFDNSCDLPAACVIKFHQINCCGTQIALGISSSASASFDQAEAACEAMYPPCGCAQQPTKAQDGKVATDRSMIKVDCQLGACQTFVP